ncbi:MAG: hypothetical protein HY690_00300 [Chloroflexi bacterium]|nr:hypothetical protein [Chloroflexota bacterium]
MSAATELILPLESSSATLSVAGGKGANLSRLVRAGYPVPPGFVVRTEAYRAFVAANGLEARIVELASATHADDPASVESASAAIRQLFAGGTMPPHLAAAIVRAYRDLAGAHTAPDLPVAVRSSATAEDLPEASFAGQQDSFLNVRGEGALLEAIKACWASLWTARALAYRARHALDPASVALAVVVQRLVPAEAAGILFTLNPVAGDASEVVIEAAWGLGEAIVGGRVSPDTVVVDRASGAVKQVRLGDKAVMAVAAAVGTADVAVDSARRAQPALAPEQAAELARLGCAIEALFGDPQDIEWALAANQIFILQARPVTTAPTSAAPAGAVPGDDAWPTPGERPRQPFDLWTHADMGERWPEPITPLTWSAIAPITNANIDHMFQGIKTPDTRQIQWSQRFYGRVYLNEGAMAYVMTRGYGLPGSMVDAAMGSDVPAEYRRGERLHLLRLLRSLPTMLRQSRERMRNERVYEALFPQIEAWVAEFQRRDLRAVDDRALWHELSAVWTPRLGQAIDLHADASSQALTGMASLEWLVQRWAGDRALAGELVGGLADLRAAEMAPALFRMARQVRDLGLAETVLERSPEEALAALRAAPAARPVLEALDRFLARHGHRADMEAELRSPRWVEAPAQVVASLAGYLRAGDAADPASAEAVQGRRRQETRARLEARLDPLRRRVLRGTVARVQHLVRLRDNGQHYVVMLLLPLRRLFAELGRRWAERGWLSRADDVFFLALAEIGAVVQAGAPAGAGLDLPALAAGRRAAHAHWCALPAPEVIGPDGQPIGEDVAGALAEGVLVGIPASGGRVRGPARLAASPQEAARLRPGDILVTRSTDPGWTPVFPLIAGLVLEVGGQLSHGAIVAREFGLPAVVNVRDATRRIPDGCPITVDGSSGRVYLEPQGERHAG